ncbi:MAG TPA: DAK2 domain-containing protein [Pseudogracilibacillus sp.]|nr:DAK2 domain-containing protein [Pseudogracilibacillus sp.]
MGIKTIDRSLFVQMVRNGLRNLTINKDLINKLNVFPVPDGDTGTNMHLSLTSGVKEVEQVKDESIQKIVASFSRGLLMGARGNSGVILSQIFRGFGAHLESVDEVTVAELALAFDAGVDTAYKSVTDPVEGTILTVAKDAAKRALELKDETDMVTFFEEVVEEANASLARTPDLLPVLKEVGVVDSGGKGLVVIYEGFLAAVKGEEITEVVHDLVDEDAIEDVHERSVQSYIDIESIEYGYCTEFIVKFKEDKLAEHPFNEASFRETLTNYGDSLLVASDDTMVKVHIHAEHPGDVMTIAQQYGDLTKIKIENMREQYADIVEEDQKKSKDEIIDAGENGIISVAAGQGMIDMFYSIGASYIIEGGQTMNPSTEDIVSAINKVNAKNVYIFPNNKNIILSAEQAKNLIDDKNVIVVPSKTIPQGIHAILEFDETASLEESIETLTEAVKEVKTGSVTYAIRDTVINDIDVKKDHFIGLTDETIVTTAADKVATAKQLIDKLVDEDEDEIITVFFGDDVTEAEKEAISAYVEHLFEDELDIELIDGGQPIYSFIIMVN